MSKTLHLRSARLPSAAAFGIAAQVLLLLALAGAPARWAACALALLGAVLIGLSARLSRAQPRPLLEMLLVTGGLGGLGMLVGSMLDASGATPGTGVMPPCHVAAAPHAVLAMPWLGFDLVPSLSWMNGLMLLACVGGCLLLCPRQVPCRPSDYLGLCTTQGILSIGMLLGMSFGGRLGSSPLARAFGDAGGMHLAMLGGMLLGAAAVWPLTKVGVSRTNSTEWLELNALHSKPTTRNHP
jgi:hypothetical protein